MAERYDNLDGLRVIACLGIIAMHIKANASYVLPSVFDDVVGSFTHFVPLFLIISGFGMFCGYYTRLKNNNIDLDSFYSKRYKKLLPFFATLILIDIIVDQSFEHIIEGFTEATLVFALLPNNELDVIGVSWTLGVIFLFYMLFPFIVYLCWTPKRACVTFVLSMILSLFCSFYFFTDKYVIADFTHRHNFLYCAPWFLSGGVTYLYRGKIKEFISRYRLAWLCLCVFLTVSYYVVPVNIPLVPKLLIVFWPWLIYSISVESRILSNSVMKYLSGISLELYLAQMVIFRGVEKLHGLYILGNGLLGFMTTCLFVVGSLIVFIEVWKYLERFVMEMFTMEATCRN
ncbi:protein of unknown function DUF33 [Anaerovibrio sp. JC8]|uniref:acyltransferase family protein n=1 Tax=Anaerovibrio sp. JC8 TaxID=1240085 RepID=UPI000A0B738B|nr:acyltransferase [Anaerovibrio sp. JC8]ORU01447.1 protein of unknown function DUF33 [Anaerovibrio sp. JC8]